MAILPSSLRRTKPYMVKWTVGKRALHASIQGLLWLNIFNIIQLLAYDIAPPGSYPLISTPATSHHRTNTDHSLTL
jgi:hypothetical protein